MFRCASKVVLQFTLLTFAIAPFMCDDDINKADDIAWVMEGLDWKEIIIIASFDYFAQDTSELDLFLPPRFPCQKEAQNPLLFGAWSRKGFINGSSNNPQLE